MLRSRIDEALRELQEAVEGFGRRGHLKTVMFL